MYMFPVWVEWQHAQQPFALRPIVYLVHMQVGRQTRVHADWRTHLYCISDVGLNKTLGALCGARGRPLERVKN